MNLSHTQTQLPRASATYVRVRVRTRALRAINSRSPDHTHGIDPGTVLRVECARNPVLV